MEINQLFSINKTIFALSIVRGLNKTFITAFLVSSYLTDQAFFILFIMIAKVTFEIEVTDFVEDKDLTIPEAETQLEELISESVGNKLQYPDNFKIEITND